MKPLSFIFILIWGIYLLTLAYADTKIDYFKESINQTECKKVIDEIPKKWFNGVKRVVITDKPNPQVAGYYYHGGVIIIYIGCDQEVLIHELAHHEQAKRGVRAFSLPHDDAYWDVYFEIYKSMD